MDMENFPFDGLIRLIFYIRLNNFRYLPTDVEAAVHSSLPPQLPIPPTSADTLRVPKSFNTGTPVSPNVDQSFELGSNTNGLSWESKEVYIAFICFYLF